MTRITPFDSFLHDLFSWLDSAWYVWVALALTVVVVTVAIVFAKRRARVRARIPQYRRQSP